MRGPWTTIFPLGPIGTANGYAAIGAERWPHLFGQNVPFLKWSLAVLCLRSGAPCGQVVNVHSIRCVTA